MGMNKRDKRNLKLPCEYISLSMLSEKAPQSSLCMKQRETERLLERTATIISHGRALYTHVKP